MRLFGVRRADIESFGRDLEAPGGPGRRLLAGCARSPGSTSTRSRRNCWAILRPCTSAVPGWTTSPMPPAWTATRSAPCWSRQGSAPRPSSPDLAARTERAAGLRGRRRRHRALGTERGHRTLAITRKGGEKAVIPLAPRTARAIDLAVGERCEGPIFTTPAGQRLDRHGAGRIVRRVARRAGLAKRNRPAHPPPRLHHLYQFRRRRPAARRPASGLAPRPENHDPLRPGPGLAGPPRHLHRRRLHRRSRPVTAPRGRTAWQRHSRQAARRRQLARARSRSATYWRGQIARRGLVMY